MKLQLKMKSHGYYQALRRHKQTHFFRVLYFRNTFLLSIVSLIVMEISF
jgi:hypothetical protein